VKERGGLIFGIYGFYSLSCKIYARICICFNAAVVYKSYLLLMIIVRYPK